MIEFTTQDLDDIAKSDLGKWERLADNFEWIHKQYYSLKKNMIINTLLSRTKG
jgi:hypothetical protein